MALYFFSQPNYVFASPTSKSETHQDIIEKAQNLILQKDRQQALFILNKAMQRETKAAAVLELKQVTVELSHKFLSDKAQQLYESSVANRQNDLNSAQQNITEALRIEPDNLSIVAELSRVLVAKGECQNAEDRAKKGLIFSEQDEELKLVYAQALSCQKRWVEAQKISEKYLRKKTEFFLYWSALEIQRSISLKNVFRAQEQLAALSKIDDKYPERDFFSWRISVEQRRKRIVDAQKYLMKCKNISANQFREYMLDPSLCRQITEVEKEVKGLNGSTD